MRKLKNFLLVFAIVFLSSCVTTTVISYDYDFTMKSDVVYLEGIEYAKLYSFNYGVENDKEIYEVVYMLSDARYLESAKNFVEYIKKEKPNWSVKVMISNRVSFI